MAESTASCISTSDQTRDPRLTTLQARTLFVLFALSCGALALMAHFEAKIGVLMATTRIQAAAAAKPAAQGSPASNPSAVGVAAGAADPTIAATARVRIGALEYIVSKPNDPCASDCGQWGPEACGRSLHCTNALNDVLGAKGRSYAYAWLGSDALFAMLYGSFIALTMLWAAPVLMLPRHIATALAVVALVAAGADLIENASLCSILRDVANGAESMSTARAVAYACSWLKWAIVLPLLAIGVSFIIRAPLRDLFWYQVAYLSVLRPPVVIAAFVVLLPLTAIESAPLTSMLGNLLVDYDRSEAFVVGLILFPTIWASMLTICLLLDSERSRGWIGLYDPKAHGYERLIGLPVRSYWVFGCFTALALPTLVVVAWTAREPAWAVLMMLLGGSMALALMDISLSLFRCAGEGARMLPWEPLFYRFALRHRGFEKRLCSFHAFFRRMASIPARNLSMPDAIFDGTSTPRLLNDDHTFAAWCLATLFCVYVGVYLMLRYFVAREDFSVMYALPPAAFIYLLLLWLTWIFSFAWFLFWRYRVILVAFIVIGAFFYAASRGAGARYGYDVVEAKIDATQNAAADLQVLTPAQVLAPLGPEDPVIIVAASGGGIAAAGWTTKVLGELHQRISDFPRKLRLLSTVSGGSVGAVHFVRELPMRADAAPQLRKVIGNSMDTSLSATTYAFALGEPLRATFSWVAGRESDRGWLQERIWAWNANGRRKADPLLLSSWSPDVARGVRPAMIMNATVMETGERVAITNVDSLRDAGCGRASEMKRLLCPLTLSQFLSSDGKSQWTLDVWTAARLSATFSYVSPPAIPQPPRQAKLDPASARHLIDGGYHDNFGVASALDWMNHAMPDLKGRKIAFIEIRANPNGDQLQAADDLLSEWLGPVLGMWNSWWRSQSESNDMAVAQFGRQLGERFASFIFVPERSVPLSWHLSCRQKETVCDAWSDSHNQMQLQELLKFLGEPTDNPRACQIDCDFSAQECVRSAAEDNTRRCDSLSNPPAPALAREG